MIRYFLASLVGAAIVIIALAVWLMTFAPVHAEECSLMIASHYGSESGSRTATGEKFTGQSMTAAHRSLPFGTKLRVTYKGKSVTVRINDRGPYVKGRSLDLSTAAARKIGLTKAGVGKVTACRIG